MLKTYRGSCHCGAVKYEADIDLARGTNKCNCSLCTKSRNWNVILKPAEFRLLSGEQALTDYQFGRGVAHHFFCTHCGVRIFGRGYVAEVGGHYVSVQVMTLDDSDPVDLVTAPVRFADGRNDNWSAPPAECRHL